MSGKCEGEGNVWPHKYNKPEDISDETYRKHGMPPEGLMEIVESERYGRDAQLQAANVMGWRWTRKGGYER